MFNFLFLPSFQVRQHPEEQRRALQALPRHRPRLPPQVRRLEGRGRHHRRQGPGRVRILLGLRRR